MLTIYQILEKYKGKRKAFEDSEDFKFFLKYRDLLLNKISRFSFLYAKDNNEFDVIRANIMLRAYLNKQAIEQEVISIATQMDKEKMPQSQFISILKERIIDLPYLYFSKVKIYVPLFSTPLNMVYTKHPEKLLSYPYSLLGEDFNETIIDGFDVYGVNLFDSYFTSLIKVGTNGKEVAFFNYDTFTLYIVNSQGRLDNQIVLFDKYLKKVTDSHMLDRLKPVVDAYFYGTRDEFISSLHENSFISDKLVGIIKKLDYERKHI